MSSYFKTKNDLLAEIENALEAVVFGSVEIYITDKKVTQITVRNIKKTSIDINESEEETPHNQKPKVFTIHARLGRLREQQ